jgi:DNA-binding response OmpR family regulator
MSKILIVEDDVELASILKTWLQLRKFAVQAVHTGEEAVEQLSFGEYDAVILDWHLPDAEGVDICKQFREQGGSIPIIMLSGNTSDKERQEGMAAGASDYFTKPFDFEKVSNKLKELLQI